MAGKTKIEWCDATWNPIVGCSHISPGCDHCYAERMARRQATGMGRRRRKVDFTTNAYRQVAKWHGVTARTEACYPTPTPKRVFVGSMTDLFHAATPFGWLDQIWAVMGCCAAPDMQRVTFIMLTKRPGQMLLYARYRSDHGMVFALPNLWLGVTVENQEQAAARIPHLIECPAARRIISCEPMLEDIRCDHWLRGRTLGITRDMRCVGPERRLIDWVIAGGETGPGARLMPWSAAYGMLDQCLASSTPFFYKGAGTATRDGRRVRKTDPDYYELRGQRWQQMPGEVT